jgi:signal transduction histidine kinase
VISLSSWLVSGRANFEPYGIAPIGLSFRRQEQEVEYQRFILKFTVSHIRFSLVMAMVIIVLYGFIDPFIYEDRGSLTYALLVRFLIVLPAPLLMCLFTFHHRYPAYASFTGVLGTTAVSFGFYLINSHNSNALIVIYTFPAIVMATIYAFFFVGLFFRYAVATAVLANTIYSFAIWTANLPAAMALAADISMCTILLLLAVAAYQKELISRQLFVSETREREAMVRQQQNDSRYLAWLRQLAAFLRHEVRHPVAKINSSIEVIQLACKNSDQLQPHFASAILGTQDVWNLIERASRATDAEAFVRQFQPQWTDLRHLLEEQLGAFRQSNSGIDFQLECTSSFRVYVDTTQIKEAVGNLLSNAASFANEGSLVQVACTGDAARITIGVTNRGPQVGSDTEALFGPFMSTRSGPASEHQGLGLYLVRLIAEQHGGTAAIGNLNDGSGVRASIALPVAT